MICLMSKSTIAVLLLALATLALAAESNFKTYKVQQGLTFVNAEEESFRLGVYTANVRQIEANNANPKSTHLEGVNQFTHMTKAEFKRKILGTKASVVQVAAVTPSVGWNIANSTDWTKTSGLVTPVKNQGGCGSGYAFSAVGALEGLNFQTSKTRIIFSEQQLIECSRSYGNNGCNSGVVTKAFDYVKANGITNLSVYPQRPV